MFHPMFSGYHWQMDGRSQESQEAAGQHRDAQGKLQFSILYLRMRFCLAEKCKNTSVMTSSRAHKSLFFSPLSMALIAWPFFMFSRWFSIEFHIVWWLRRLFDVKIHSCAKNHHWNVFAELARAKITDEKCPKRLSLQCGRQFRGQFN